MKHVLKLVACLYAMTVIVNAQTQEQSNPQSPIIQDAFRFDVYSDIPLKEELLRLDNIAQASRSEPNAVIYFVAYGGERSCMGEAQARATFSKNYLIKKQGILPERIMWKDGGYLEKSTIEVWILPPGVEPNPTLAANPNSVQSRKCRSKYLRQVQRGKS
jgi:hypothetical protein